MGQPFDKRAQLGGHLKRALRDATTFWGLIAWSQMSGLRVLEPYLRGLRARGGSSYLVTGIDGGIATVEALELAGGMFDTVEVFHDRSSRTYHPKIYCAESRQESVVVVGSSNLTKGGLYGNYEGNIWLRLREHNAIDRRLIARIRGFRDDLRSKGMPLRRLDQALIDRLALTNVLVTREARRAAVAARRQDAAYALAGDIFGARSVTLPAYCPPTYVSVPRSATRSKNAPTVLNNKRLPKPLEQWWKQLTRSDAIRKRHSHQRYYVVLGKAGFELDQKTWFRRVFFDRVLWRLETMKTGRRKEVADIPFQVFIEKKHLGGFMLRIEHARHRIAGQNNSPTWLHWSALVPTILRRNVMGWYMVLQKQPRHYILLLSKAVPEEAAANS